MAYIQDRKCHGRRSFSARRSKLFFIFYFFSDGRRIIFFLDISRASIGGTLVVRGIDRRVVVLNL